jgi:hypothetical protein
MLAKYVLNDGISQAFLPFRFVDVIVITDHDLFWNVGQANCMENNLPFCDEWRALLCIYSVKSTIF